MRSPHPTGRFSAAPSVKAIFQIPSKRCRYRLRSGDRGHPSPQQVDFGMQGMQVILHGRGAYPDQQGRDHAQIVDSVSKKGENSVCVLMAKSRMVGILGSWKHLQMLPQSLIDFFSLFSLPNMHTAPEVLATPVRSMLQVGATGRSKVPGERHKHQLHQFRWGKLSGNRCTRRHPLMLIQIRIYLVGEKCIRTRSKLSLLCFNIYFLSCT
jgi:hypothetical protein